MLVDKGTRLNADLKPARWMGSTKVGPRFIKSREIAMRESGL